jgi:hypothetical protein
MDQLCIDQNNIDEKNQEVSKMRQYYNNSAVTLISIQTNADFDKKNKLDYFNFIDVLGIVINSEWFTRSWTFQEGFLSKQTVFMFDDILVDGRELAYTWVSLFNRSSVTNYGEVASLDLPSVSSGSKKIATPVGWTYFKDGYNSEDKLSLGLHEALRAIKTRKRSISVDGIYSILGLLPYGEQVEVKYKEWGSRYSQKELHEVLENVMKVAVGNGYGEPFGWFGKRNELLELCWAPKIDKNGSTSVVGGVKIRFSPNSISFIPSGIKLKCSKYSIHSVEKESNNAMEFIWNNSLGGLGGKFLTPIDENSYERKITIKLVDGDDISKYDYETITLSGERKTLEELGNEIKKRECFLLLPDDKKWKSDKIPALLVSKVDGNYCRIGLVLLLDCYEAGDIQRIKEEEEIIIGEANLSREKYQQGSWFKKLFGKSREQEQQTEAQIQIPPK